jgi:tetratricopeptide (TPR) repeat protein
VELAIQAAAVKKYDEAASLWQRALAIDPSSPLAYFNLGHVCLQMGMFKEGRDAEKRAMELKQDYREAQVNYLLCQLCLGNIDGALLEVEQFLAKNPDYPVLLLMRGILWATVGNGEKAIQEFRALQNNQVEFSHFIHDVTGKLLQAGQRNYADNLVAVSQKLGVCKEETVLLLNSEKRSS